MANSRIAVTEGAGKNIDTWDRTISSQLVQDQFVLPGEYPYATYVVHATAISGATTGDDIVQIMAGASTYVRIRRIEIMQRVAMTTAQEFSVDVIRVTTAGTGGGAVTPAKFDTGDAAAAATAASAVPNATHGTASTTLFTLRFWGVQTIGTGGIGGGLWDRWEQMPNTKPIVIPTGTTNGIALRVQTGRAGIQVDADVEFVETTWLGA